MAKHTCGFPECDRPAHYRDYCEGHRGQLRRGVELKPLRSHGGGRCSIADCTKPLRSRGWCGLHYDRWREHGDPLWEPPPQIPRIPNACNFPGCGNERWTQDYCGPHRKQLREGAELRPLNPQRKYVIDHRFFDQIDTEEKAYWLGFITADGSISSGRWPSLRIELQEADEGHLLKFARAVGTDAPVKASGQRCVKISVSSPHLVEGLRSLGITSRKSLVVAPPLERLRGLERYYWRGLWDGDGTISKMSRDRGGWDIGFVGSLACVSAFGSWARGISGSRAQPNNKSSKNPDFWQWHVGGTRKAQLLAEQLRLAGPGFGLERKQLLLEQFCAFDLAAHEDRVRADRRIQLRAAHNGWLARRREAAREGLIPLWD